MQVSQHIPTLRPGQNINFRDLTLKPNQRIDFKADQHQVKFFIGEKGVFCYETVTFYEPITASQTLSKIKTILRSDRYIKQWGALRTLIDRISDKYTQKYYNFCSLSQWYYFDDLKEVLLKANELRKIILIRYENLSNPPKALPLNLEFTHAVCDKLPVKSLAQFALVNRTAKAEVDSYFIHLARKWNFRGENDPLLAKEYLEYIPTLINFLYKKNCIVDSFANFNTEGQLDVEATLISWHQNTLETFMYFKQEEQIWKVIYSSFLSSGQIERFSRILLDMGLDPTLRDENGNTAFHHAVITSSPYLPYGTYYVKSFLTILNKNLSAEMMDIENNKGETPNMLLKSLQQKEDEEIRKRHKRWDVKPCERQVYSYDRFSTPFP